MKKSILLFFIFIFLLPNALIVLAEESSDSKSQDGLQEEQAYKMLYEDLKDANGKMLDTVYFALTFASAFILLFLAANFWSATQSRKKEFEALKAENTLAIANIQNDLRGQMIEEFEGLKKNHEEKIENMIKKFSIETKKAIKTLEAISEDNRDTLIEIKGEIEMIQGDFWFELGYYSIALTHYIEYGKNGLEMDYVVEDSLNNILRTIAKVKSMNLSVMPHEIEDVSQFLHELPDSNSNIAHRISEILKIIPISG
ncbi:hypothetical protein ACFCVU_06405 [Peribacillus butanolivorans]|uniref:hypothetical protein n=1 Tax=Peribacillus butanolivorans TaxID=421767 RepID=UPI0035E0743F